MNKYHKTDLNPQIERQFFQQYDHELIELWDCNYMRPDDFINYDPVVETFSLEVDQQLRDGLLHSQVLSEIKNK